MTTDTEHRWIVQVMQSDDDDWQPHDGPAYATEKAAQAVADELFYSGAVAQAAVFDKHA